jgi:hypothetical protein
MRWAKFWAILKQTHLVTLRVNAKRFFPTWEGFFTNLR